jgi:hypothetical protein
MSPNRARGIGVVALLMIVFGLAEVATGFAHSFFGMAAGSSVAATYGDIFIGTLYAASGLLILTMSRRAAALAVGFLIVDIIGRIALIATGLYPTNSFAQTLSIITGTAIVAIFAIYMVVKWPSFS